MVVVDLRRNKLEKVLRSGRSSRFHASGKKVATIYCCRKETARLNLEIEQDQAEPEMFPP
jgi:hypothetical protein